MSIGEEIRRIRKEKGLSQSDLAALLGVSQQMIGLYETNKRTPKYETIQKIAKKLEVPVNALTTTIPEYQDFAEPYSDMLNINASLALSNIFHLFDSIDNQKRLDLFGDFLRYSHLDFKAGRKNGKMGKYFSFDGGKNYEYFLSNLEAEHLPEIVIAKIKSIIQQSNTLDDIDFED